MKTTRSVLAIAALLAGVMAAGEASAQHRRHHHGPRVSIGFGFGFGVPFAAYPYYAPFYSPFHYPAYSYYPSPVIVQQQAPVYVEQDPQSAPSAQPSAPAGYWYYCTASGAYYPYVNECPGGWHRVAPQPG